MVAVPDNWTYRELVDQDLEFTSQQMTAFKFDEWAGKFAQRLEHNLAVMEAMNTADMRGVAVRRSIVGATQTFLSEVRMRLGLQTEDDATAAASLKKEALDTEEMHFMDSEVRAAFSAMQYLATMMACHMDAKNLSREDRSRGNIMLNQLNMYRSRLEKAMVTLESKRERSGE